MGGKLIVDATSKLITNGAIAPFCIVDRANSVSSSAVLSLPYIPTGTQIESVVGNDTGSSVTYWSLVSTGGSLGVTNENSEPVTLTGAYIGLLNFAVPPATTPDTTPNTTPDTTPNTTPDTTPNTTPDIMPTNDNNPIDKPINTNTPNDVKPTVITTPNVEKQVVKEKTKNPKTGDKMPVAPFIGLLSLITIAFAKKKISSK